MQEYTCRNRKIRTFVVINPEFLIGTEKMYRLQKLEKFRNKYVMQDCILIKKREREREVKNTVKREQCVKCKLYNFPFRINLIRRNHEDVSNEICKFDRKIS